MSLQILSCLDHATCSTGGKRDRIRSGCARPLAPTRGISGEFDLMFFVRLQIPRWPEQRLQINDGPPPCQTAFLVACFQGTWYWQKSQQTFGKTGLPMSCLIYGDHHMTDVRGLRETPGRWKLYADLDKHNTEQERGITDPQPLALGFSQIGDERQVTATKRAALRTCPGRTGCAEPETCNTS
eukprot:9474841-Pyramimonas_sp.AAC.1